MTIREALTPADIAAFWDGLHAYFMRDIFPDPADEDLAYFLSNEYRTQIQHLHDRPQDKCRYLFFEHDGQTIGFAMPVIYNTEDGKCFIMEFCVYPEFRGGGTGTACAHALLDWAKSNGASYAELNNGGHAGRRRFWSRLGFIDNGVDEWGEPLMLLPPAETLPVDVGLLTDAEDWQLLKLENSFLQEIGEPLLDEARQEQLQQAVRDGRIVYFLAKRGSRAIGMCSVVRCFSTFACADTGVLDDFYVEPAFRRQGAARPLIRTAQTWCREHGLVSLTACCAPCDEEMYQALGFTVKLGTTYACPIAE